MAKIITFHVDAKGFYIHSYMSCINSKWLNRVGVGAVWGGGGGELWQRQRHSMWMQRAFAFIQVRINGGRREGCGVGGWGLGGWGGTMAKILTFHVDAIGF